MIFKFDKGGNMNMEGDIQDMARKGKDKDRFAQMDIGVVNSVKEEVLGMVNEAVSQTAVGYQEAMDENDEDMVQQHETELIKEMDAEVDDEKLKQQMRELNMRNMPSLSNLNRMKDEGDGNGCEEESRGEESSGEGGGVGSDKDKIQKEEFNEEYSDAQRKKDELAKKREANKLKKQMKERLEQLNSAEEWKFENVVEIFRNGELVKYQTTANIEVLATYFDRHILSYNGELQRGYRNGKNGELLAIRSQKQVNLIYESICKNRMHGGFLTVNWNPEKGDINFDEDEHTLSGSINQKLDILDGQHRLCSFSKILKAYRKNPESVPNPANYEIGIVIELLNDDDAKSLFSEYSTKSLKISKSRGEFLNVEDNTNRLCREIIKKSDLHNRVEVVSTSISAKSPSIITFGVLSKIIKENYTPSTKVEIEELSNYLTLFIDSLIQTFPKYMSSKDLEERKSLREKNLAMEALSWGAYMKLSKRLQGKTKEELLTILDKFNMEVEYKGWKGSFLDKENPIFRKIMREGFKVINTSSSATWINKVFAEYAIENKTLEEIGKEEAK